MRFWMLYLQIKAPMDQPIFSESFGIEGGLLTGRKNPKGSFKAKTSKPRLPTRTLPMVFFISSRFIAQVLEAQFLLLAFPVSLVHKGTKPLYDILHTKWTEVPV